jgi:AAA15 family ATPase/GTPase
MLIEFRVKNFKSFMDEQTLSMVASSEKSLPQNTISTPALRRVRLVRSAAVYGANASGKSNLVSAVQFVGDFVRNSAKRTPDALIPVQPFLLDTESNQRPTEFEISFVREGVRYEYGFSVDVERVYGEWLIAYPKGVAQTWFERSSNPGATEDDWYFGRYLKGEKNKLIPLTRQNVLFLSVAAQFNNPQLTVVHEWFSKMLHIIGPGIPSGFLEFMTSRRVHENADLHSRIRNLLKVADLGIMDFSIVEKAALKPAEELPEETPDELKKIVKPLSKLAGDKQLSVSVQHQVMEGDSTSVAFDLEDESQGTRRLFGIGSLLFYVLEEGAVLVIDELDASLHPALARELVRMFHDPKLNPNGAQLVFNTHDTTLLDLTLLRRDQIWFTEKDKSGSTHLYSLLEFKPRKTEAISKGYLQGRYGAIPFLSITEGFLADGS